MRLLEERMEIAAPSHVVWEVLADFGTVSSWVPSMRVSRLVGTQATGVGTRRAMRHAWGFRFEEEVTQWHESKGYAFDVLKAPFPMQQVKETWVIGEQRHRTVVETQVRYGMGLGPVGALIDWALVRFVVRREMRAGLDGLRRFCEQRAADRR
ncbi:MAG: SRPBCC family protein [Lysobacterales bacterium]|jgi:ligand-binding SRPBCC domain-containing protein